MRCATLENTGAFSGLLTTLQTKNSYELILVLTDTCGTWQQNWVAKNTGYSNKRKEKRYANAFNNNEKQRLMQDPTSSKLGLHFLPVSVRLQKYVRGTTMS